MLLKRHYTTPEGWEAEPNVRDAAGNLPDPTRPEGAVLNAVPLDYVSVIHTGVKPAQNFSRRLVETAVGEGWMTLSRGKIIVHAESEDFTYTIVRVPGRYCLHCDAHWASDPTGSEARAHLAAEHPGAVSPDPQWPLGYKACESYECVLDEEQHAKWHCPDYAKVSHTRWKEEGTGTGT